MAKWRWFAGDLVELPHIQINFHNLLNSKITLAAAGFRKRDERPVDPCIRGKGWRYHLFQPWIISQRRLSGTRPSAATFSVKSRSCEKTCVTWRSSPCFSKPSRSMSKLTRRDFLNGTLMATGASLLPSDHMENRSQMLWIHRNIRPREQDSADCRLLIFISKST